MDLPMDLPTLPNHIVDGSSIYAESATLSYDLTAHPSVADWWQEYRSANDLQFDVDPGRLTVADLSHNTNSNHNTSNQPLTAEQVQRLLRLEIAVNLLLHCVQQNLMMITPRLGYGQLQHDVLQQLIDNATD